MSTPNLDDPFAPPPGGSWQPIAPQLAGIRRLASLLTAAPLIIALSAGSWALWHRWWPPAIVAAVALSTLGWRAVRASAWVRAWGWCETDEELWLRHGLLVRRLAVVPIGRLQMVKVAAGPMLKRHGLAHVELVTATPESNATIPALPADVAAALRDRLVAKSDARGSGL